MGRSIAATARGASADSSRRCRSPNLRTECHSGWTFKGPRALRPLRPGATANPEHWLCALFLWTLKEGSSSGGPPDFRACPKSIALKGSVNSTPRPAKAKEKHAGLSRPLGRPRVKRTIPAKQFVNEHRLIIIGTVPAAAHRPPSRPFGRHRNVLLSVGLFSNDQSLKRGHLCIRGLHAVRSRHRIFRRAGLRRGPEPAPFVRRYRLSLLACEASRWRFRFLCDRRRRFMLQQPAFHRAKRRNSSP
jgi:hypothetical protein